MLGKKPPSVTKISGAESERRTLSGSCLCDAVHYEVADEFRYAMNCHCSDCRKATGSAFKPFGGIEREKLKITKGEEQHWRHDARIS